METKLENMSEVLAKINSKMHEGRCPQSGCIGECAAIDETTPGVWWAALYIWDDNFNDSTLVAKWFHDAGAVDVLVSHVLYDSANDDRDGRCFDGVRAWHVQFSMPQNATAIDQGKWRKIPDKSKGEPAVEISGGQLQSAHNA